MQLPWRKRFPLAFGIASIPLFVWDAYNQQAILNAGMGFDTGIPLWPWETPRMLLTILHLPAAIVAYRVAGLIPSGPHWIWTQDALLAVLLLLWWWWVGTWVDYGLIQPHRVKLPRTVTLLLALVAIGMAALGAYNLHATLSWWNGWGALDPDSLIRTGSGILVTLWFAGLAMLSVRACRRLLRAGRDAARG